MSNVRLAAFGSGTLLGAGVPDAGFRIRSPRCSRIGTMCAMAVLRSRTASDSPRCTLRRNSLSFDFSSAIRTCFMTIYDYKWS